MHPVRFVGLARTMYIRCVYGVFGRGITKSTAIYGVYIRFWPSLEVCKGGLDDRGMHPVRFVGLARTIYINGVCTVFLEGKSPKVRPYTVYLYGSGQP